MSLAGKGALITGVSRQRGIGAAVARRLAEAGADIFTTYFRPYDTEMMPWGSSPNEAEAIVDSLRGSGVRCEGFELDLAEPGAARQLFDRAEQALGQIDILVNNAAVDFEGPLESLTAELLDRHYAVNFRVVALLSAEFFRRFQGSSGRIINLTTGQGLAAMPENIAYAATKGAVEAMTLSMAPGMAAKRITIHAVDPGATDTGWMSADQKESLAAQTPLGRVVTPEDAAELIRFLASEEGGWITGQVIRSRGAQG